LSDEAARPFRKRLYDGWLLVAAYFGEVQTLIIVTLVYTLVMGPIALIAAAAQRDLLEKRKLRTGGSAWRDADSTTSPDLARAKRLF
jgi:hypothetical protein